MAIDNNFNKTTILDYIKNVDSTFSNKPLNEIDCLIFSQFSYLDFSQICTKKSKWIKISQLYKSELFDFFTKSTLTPSSNLELLKSLCSSPRFRDVELNFHENIYDKSSEVQFSATTFRLPTSHNIVAFRGTDLSITGWKEDFNMCFISPIPSQETAVLYLDKVAKITKGPITVVGHSKGGNLSTFSSCFCTKKTQNRIKSVFNFDGPGFPVDIFENHNFIKEQNKITKIVPEGSIVGVLFENSDDIRIVRSNNFSLMQHDPFSWVCDCEKFISCNKFSNNVIHVDKTLNKWIYELDTNQRKTLIDTVFTIINSTQAENIDEFSKMAFKNREQIICALKSVDAQTLDCIKAMFNSYLRVSLDAVFDFKFENNFKEFFGNFFSK